MFKDASLVINLEKKNSNEVPMYLKMLAMVLECNRYSYCLFRLCMYSFFFYSLVSPSREFLLSVGLSRMSKIRQQFLMMAQRVSCELLMWSTGAGS